MMPDNTDDSIIGYADAALTYWERGWRGILPLVRGRKGGTGANLPIGRTGKAGEDPSYADVYAWTEDRPNDNLCLRLPDTIIGIDVDNYGAKNGGDTLAEAEKRWGKLPPTIRTTSRDDGISGIRLYKVPAGTRFIESINFTELGLGDIEIIQSFHRYAVSWPSIHPEGRPYLWQDDNNTTVEIPWLDNIVELPETWVENLTAPPATLGPVPVPGVGYDVAEALTKGAASPAVSARLSQAINELSIPGVCHHDTARDHALALLRLGKNGEAGVDGALAALGQIFVMHTKDNRAGGEAEAKREFRNLIFGPGAARELSQPGNDDWVRALIVEAADAAKEEIRLAAAGPTVDELIEAAQEALADGDDEKAAELFDQASMLETQNQQKAKVAAEPVTPPPAPPTTELDFYSDEESSFWQSRASLTQIHDAALSRMCAPWAVLAHCAARALTIVRPCATTPPFVGGPGSLNMFFIVTGVSGSGKSAAEEVARELVDIPVEQRSLGTGEGFLEAFIRPANRETGEPSGYYESIMMIADESDTVSALKNRSGSTLEGILKEAWTAKRVGFGYRGRNNEKLNAHSYRLTLVMGVQPTKAGWILEDNGGGFPQRFMWFPSRDHRAWEAYEAAEADELKTGIPYTAPQIWPLILPSWRDWEFPQTIPVPDEARKLIRLAAAQAHLGGIENPLDGHALFCRLKFAYALTVLDGRSKMTLEDWELSGVAARLSERVRGWVVSRMGDVAQAEAEEQGRLRGVSAAASDAEKAFQEAERDQRLTDRIITKLGDAPLTPRELGQLFNGRDRSRAMGPVLNALAQAGQVGFEDGKWELR